MDDCNKEAEAEIAVSRDMLYLRPYHHGRNPEFQLGEQVKDDVRDLVCPAKDKGLLLNIPPASKISANQVPQIQSFERMSEDSDDIMVQAGAYNYKFTAIPEPQGELHRELHRVLHRVPPRRRENMRDVFDPAVLSLGPYNYQHGLQNPEFQLGEMVKDEVCDIVCRATDKDGLLAEIGARVDEIRHFYSDGLERYSYSHDELCELMLRDACFVLRYMDIEEQSKNEFYSILYRVLGMSGTLFVNQDIYKLENQIPLWLIQMLFSKIYGGGQSEFHKFLCDFMRKSLLKDGAKMRLPWAEGEPLHLLEAMYRISLGDSVPNKTGWTGQPPEPGLESTSSPFGSVRYLKAKGIHLEPSSDFLRDIKFFSSSFYGKLQLPILMVHNFTNIFLSNMIALEMSPGTPTDFSLTSYVVFVKALLEDAEDAKELRDKGIISNMLGSDQEVVSMFQSLDTYGFCNNDLFRDVHTRIEKHCKSKAKTWMADFLSTYFSSPWKAIALFVAIFLLTLTCIQTYYAVNPAS